MLRASVGASVLEKVLREKLPYSDKFSRGQILGHFRAEPIDTEFWKLCDRCAKFNPREDFETSYFEKKLYKKFFPAKNLREIVGYN